MYNIVCVLSKGAWMYTSVQYAAQKVAEKLPITSNDIE